MDSLARSLCCVSSDVSSVNVNVEEVEAGSQNPWTHVSRTRRWFKYLGKGKYMEMLVKPRVAEDNDKVKFEFTGKYFSEVDSDSVRFPPVKQEKRLKPKSQGRKLPEDKYVDQLVKLVDGDGNVEEILHIVYDDEFNQLFGSAEDAIQKKLKEELAQAWKACNVLKQKYARAADGINTLNHCPRLQRLAEKSRTKVRNQRNEARDRKYAQDDVESVFRPSWLERNLFPNTTSRVVSLAESAVQQTGLKVNEIISEIQAFCKKVWNMTIDAAKCLCLVRIVGDLVKSYTEANLELAIQAIAQIVLLMTFQNAGSLSNLINQVTVMVKGIFESNVRVAQDLVVHGAENGTALSDVYDNSFFASAKNMFAECTENFGFQDTVGRTMLQIGALIVGGIVCLMHGRLPTPTSMMKYFSDFGRSAIGFKHAMDLVTWFIHFLKNEASLACSGVSSEQKEMEEKYPKFNEFIEAVDFLQSPEFTMKHFRSKEFCHLTQRLLGVGEGLLATSISAENRKLTHLLETKLRFLRRKAEIANLRADAVAAEREKPYTLYNYGAPGQGKTVFNMALRYFLFKEEIEGKYEDMDVTNCYFPRKAGNEFWEGYMGQPIVEYDDIYQQVDSVTKPNPEYMEVISATNEAPYQLHMAVAEDKANSFFTSDYILATSNVQTPIPKSLQSPGAVHRRWRTCIHVKAKDELTMVVSPYKTHKSANVIDPDKVRAFYRARGEEPKPFCKEVYDITRYDMASGAAIATYTFDEFLEYLRKDIASQRTLNKNLAKSMQEQFGIEPKMGPRLTKGIEVLRKAQSEEEFSPCVEADETVADKPCDVAGGAFCNPIFSGSYTDEYGIEQSAHAMCRRVREVTEGQMEKFKTYVGAGWSKCKDIVTTAAKYVHEFFQKIPLAALAGLAAAFGFAAWKLHTRVTCRRTKALLNTKLANTWENVFDHEICGKKCVVCTTTGAVTKAFPLDRRVQSLISLMQALQQSDDAQDARLKDGVSRYLVQALQTPHLFSRYARDAHSSETRTRPATAKIMAHSNETRTKPSTSQIVAHSNETKTRVADQPRVSHDMQDMMDAYHVPQHLRFDIPEEDNVKRLFEEARVAQSSDLVCQEQVASVLSRNSVVLSSPDMPGVVNGVFVVGRILLTVNHFIQGKKNISIHNMTSRETTTIDLTKTCVTQLESKDRLLDLVLITVEGVQSRPSILKYLISASEFVVNRPFGAAFACIRISKEAIQQQLRFVMDTEAKLLGNSIDYMHKGETILLPTALEYGAWTRAGDCGGLLFSTEERGNRKLVGMHVCGDAKGIGNSAVLTLEMMERNMSRHMEGTKSYHTIDGSYPTVIKQAQDNEKIFGGVLLGTVEAVNAPSMSDIGPSLIHGKIVEPFDKPALLRPVIVDGQRIDPMEKGIAKVATSQVPMRVDPEIVERAVEDVKNLHRSFPSKNRRVLSWEEAVWGDEDLNLPCVNRKTSPGYPYCLNNPGRGKSAWLGTGDEKFIDSDLQTTLDELETRVQNGKRSQSMFLASLKDERRPIAKVDAGKTRVFAAASMPFVILVRKYFGAFSGFVMQKRIDNEIGVGTNPYSKEWHKTATALSSKGRNVFAGDFSNFDGSLRQDLLWQVYEVMESFYEGATAVERRAREVLFDELCNCDIVVRDRVVRLSHSQPSGNPLTVIINSIFNQIVMRIAFYHLAQVNQMTHVGFTSAVSLQCYGDDNVLNVADWAEWYNQQSVSEALALIGLDYTDEAKTGELCTFKTLQDVRYLKRAFVTRPVTGWVEGPLPLENVINMTNWVRGKDTYNATLENIRAATLELALFPPQIFNYYSQKIREAANTSGVHYVPLSQAEALMATILEERYFSNTHGGGYTNIPGLVPFNTLNHKNNRVANQSNEIQNTEDVVTFIEEPPRVVEVPATSYQEASNVWGQYHLKRILERPVVLKQSTWTTTDPAVPMHVLFTDYEVGTIHYKDEFLFPESIISSSRQVREKLNNYQYMRANVRVTVRVNSTPFQQGQLMLVYTPYSYYTTRFRSQANECLPSLSTFPHVKLDLRETSEAEIKVPFASVFDSYNLGDDTNPFGSMRIYVVVPVKGATDAETVTYTVSANFEDIELSVPTSRGLSTNTRYAQSDNRTKMPAEKKKGPVEKISTVVAEATGAIGSLGIPGLSLGATVVSWIARCMSGLSAVFGWSKPLITETAVPFIHTPARYMMNGEGPEESQSLSMIPDNAVHVRGVVPEDKDEMALDYIFSKDYIFSQTTIAQANTNSRKLLFTHPVSPFQPGYTSGIAPSQLCTNAMGFATLLYQNWRGDLTFKYDIVRTNFHAGRLMAVFFPETSWLDVPESLSEEMTDNLNTVYQLNAPLDQQKENEFIFTVPYISNQPYKRTCRVAEGQFDTATMETATGAVGVYAFNDMVIPETCAQEVTLIAYIQAGSNFEVAKAFPQITPGFAPAAPPLDIAQEIADGLNTMFDGDFEPVTPGSVNLSLRDLLTNGGLTKWVSDSSFSSSIPGLLGTGTLYPDGTFDADVDIVFTNSNFTVSNPVTVTITCLGGSVTAASANKGLENLNSVSETSTWVVTPSTIQKLAQSDNTSVIATTQNNDVRLATVGEYSLSLRNYIKRFGKVFSLDDFITYRPSYGSSTSSDSTNAGKRTLEFQEDDTGAFIPETPLSLVSYLYRFWGGSTMLKCHLSRRTKATCSLDLSTSAQAAKTKLDYPTPQIFQAGYINNSLSVQIPYYSSLRANVVGGTSGSDLARATIEFDTNLNAEAVYEAAGDDFSYFFLVGPPVMRPISNSPPAPVLTTQNV